MTLAIAHNSYIKLPIISGSTVTPPSKSELPNANLIELGVGIEQYVAKTDVFQPKVGLEAKSTDYAYVMPDDDHLALTLLLELINDYVENGWESRQELDRIAVQLAQSSTEVLALGIDGSLRYSLLIRDRNIASAVQRFNATLTSSICEMTGAGMDLGGTLKMLSQPKPSDMAREMLSINKTQEEARGLAKSLDAATVMVDGQPQSLVKAFSGKNHQERANLMFSDETMRESYLERVTPFGQGTIDESKIVALHDVPGGSVGVERALNDGWIVMGERGELIRLNRFGEQEMTFPDEYAFQTRAVDGGAPMRSAPMETHDFRGRSNGYTTDAFIDEEGRLTATGEESYRQHLVSRSGQLQARKNLPNDRGEEAERYFANMRLDSDKTSLNPARNRGTRAEESMNSAKDIATYYKAIVGRHGNQDAVTGPKIDFDYVKNLRPASVVGSAGVAGDASVAPQGTVAGTSSASNRLQLDVKATTDELVTGKSFVGSHGFVAIDEPNKKAYMMVYASDDGAAVVPIEIRYSDELQAEFDTFHGQPVALLSRMDNYQKMLKTKLLSPRPDVVDQKLAPNQPAETLTDSYQTSAADETFFNDFIEHRRGNYGDAVEWGSDSVDRLQMVAKFEHEVDPQKRVAELSGVVQSNFSENEAIMRMVSSFGMMTRTLGGTMGQSEQYLAEVMASEIDILRTLQNSMDAIRDAQLSSAREVRDSVRGSATAVVDSSEKAVDSLFRSANKSLAST